MQLSAESKNHNQSHNDPLPSLVTKFIGIRKSQVLRCFSCEKEHVVINGQLSNNDISKICGQSFTVLVLMEAEFSAESENYF